MRALAFALACALVCGFVSAGEQPKAPDSLPQTDLKVPEELGEVVVTGKKASTKVAELIPWLRRLTGQFDYQVRAEALQTDGQWERLPTVAGLAECRGFGPAPGVDCQLDTGWSKSEPTGRLAHSGLVDLFPVAMLYGIQPDLPGIRFLFVNSAGIAEPGLGALVDDTLTTKERCAVTKGNCERITQVTAEPDGVVIRIRIDIEVDYGKVAGATFVMRRALASPLDAPPNLQ